MGLISMYTLFNLTSYHRSHVMEPLMLGNVMGNQKALGFKISEISELARMEFEKKKSLTRNHLGKPDKKITDSVLRQLKEHEKILKNKF